MLSRCRYVYFNWFICNFISNEVLQTQFIFTLWSESERVRERERERTKEKTIEKTVKKKNPTEMKAIQWRETCVHLFFRWLRIKKATQVWSNLLNSSSHDDQHKRTAIYQIKLKKSMKPKKKHRLLFITLFGLDFGFETIWTEIMLLGHCAR